MKTVLMTSQPLITTCRSANSRCDSYQVFTISFGQYRLFLKTTSSPVIGWEPSASRPISCAAKNPEISAACGMQGYLPGLGSVSQIMGVDGCRIDKNGGGLAGEHEGKWMNAWSLTHASMLPCPAMQSRLSKQFRDNLYERNLPMLCNIPEDSMQCSYAKGFVPGNGEIRSFPLITADKRW